MFTFKDIIDLVFDKKNWKYVLTIILAAFFWVPATWIFLSKEVYTVRINDLEKDKTELKYEVDKKDKRIEKLEQDSTELSSQKSHLVIKEGRIEESSREISELNKKITELTLEKNQIESKNKELNEIINQKDIVIENFNRSSPVLAQIKELQKERYELLHPWMITGKKVNPTESERIAIKEEEDKVERIAKSLNEQIIELQKSITCKS
ncbi:hypothetical protein [Acinetobacter baumannii]|uniref:hypothetical protein n=1 Tax=Acinetobacter baumannii TaxID=470 RepID=UPI000BF53879|nr:hypothetical protein [Acinetobacter baumannii]WCS38459.1 hypothetical protein OSV60_01045 [Acinetobacter baumannii]